MKRTVQIEAWIDVMTMTGAIGFSQTMFTDAWKDREHHGAFQKIAGRCTSYQLKWRDACCTLPFISNEAGGRKESTLLRRSG